jgi:CelD/BcsL family acetyltransferase involved in cellulose biosynthesis
VSAGLGEMPSAMPGSTAAGEALRDLSTETVTSEEELIALRPAWNALAQEQDGPRSFLGHEWFRAWWTAFGGGATLAVLVARRGPHVVGIAPLAQRRIRYLGVPVRALVSLTNDHTNRYGFLVRPGPPARRKAVVEALWGEALKRTGWDVLLLQACPRGSLPVAWFLECAAAHGYRCAAWEGPRSPVLLLEPDAPAISAVLTAHRRSELRRRRAHLERSMGPLRLERVCASDHLARGLADMFDIEATGWKGVQSTAMACDGATRRFYAEIARDAAARGTLSLDFLTAGNTRIAFGYHLVEGSTWYLLKTGYHAAHAKYAPGVLFLFELFHRLQAEAAGTIEYEFLGRDDAYKLEWTARVKPHDWWYVFPPRWKSEALQALKFSWLPWVRRVVARAHRTRGIAP